MESRIIQLISALRSSGVRVSLAETAEAFAAVDLMGIQDRGRFRLSLRATLIKDLKDIPVFEKLFPLFFGSGRSPTMGGDPQKEMTTEEAGMLAEALRRFSENLRQRLERLMNGEQLSRSELESLGQLVGLNHSEDLRHQNWMTQRLERAMAFPEVRKALEELMEQLRQMGMNRARIEKIRDLIQQNMQGIQGQLQQYAGERIAENLSSRPRDDNPENLLTRPFHSLTEADKKNLQREVKRLASALRTRISLRQKRAKNGQMDPKATLRSNLKYHGVPMEIKHKDRVRKPKIVVICDISTSMRYCSEFMLSFLHALQGQIRKTDAFAFIDHLEYISGEFRGSDQDRAIASVLRRMPSGHYNTDLGRSLNDFQNSFMDTLNRGTTLIIVGDGRNNYLNPRLDIFFRMTRRVARTIWLNPEPASMWYGDSDMRKYSPLCTNVIKVGNLKQLAEAVNTLLAS